MKRSASREAFLQHARETAEELGALDAGSSAAAVDLSAGYQHGAAGVAAFLGEASRVFSSEALLAAAQRWLTVARALAKDGFVTVDPEHGDAALLPHAPLVGGAGIDWVDAVLADLSGDVRARTEALSRLRRRMHEALEVRLEPGVVLGHAGHAALAARVQGRFADLSDEECTAFADLGRAAAARALDVGSGPGAPLGLAHGRAGALWAALEAEPSASAAPASPLLVDLAEMARELAPGIFGWPAHEGAEVALERLVSWCNGTGGIVQLLTRAIEQDRSAQVRVALEAALGTLVSIRPRSPTLCCGAAGQALVLDVLARSSGNALRRQLDPTVRALLRHAMAKTERLPANLFSGRAGVAYAALALADSTVDRPLGFSPRRS